MEFKESDLKGLYLIKPDVFEDNRGFFVESYSQIKFKDVGLDTVFVQDNHSRSEECGVLRGLHFQKSPFAQTKLVRVTRGAIFDVVVDIRRTSLTFGQWRGFELTENNFLMLYVPKGFAHGFCTLEPGTEVQYKVDAFYAPQSESGIHWNDPVLKINWPVKDPVLSKKDALLPGFDADSY